VVDRNGRLFPKLLDFGIAKLIGEFALPVPEQPEGTEAVTTAPLRASRRRAQRTRTDPAAKDHRLTRTSAKLGSTAYMSPEQWTHPQAVGAASDLYSLGVLAYDVSPPASKGTISTGITGIQGTTLRRRRALGGLRV